MSCSGTPVETPERGAAQARLVSRAAAAWGAAATQLALPGLRRAKTSDERDLLLHELARTVELEASHYLAGHRQLGAGLGGEALLDGLELLFEHRAGVQERLGRAA